MQAMTPGSPKMLRRIGLKVPILYTATVQHEMFNSFFSLLLQFPGSVIMFEAVTAL
jgi:hypothetical protein